MSTDVVQFQGQAGVIDCAIDWPSTDEVKGWALLLHPHPLYDGARDNKVITTLARLCNQLGLVAVRPNFRGVGLSGGQFDAAHGETLDMLALYDQFKMQYPEIANQRFVLGGFSFGTAVATQLYNELEDRGEKLPDSLVLAGAAAWRFKWRDIRLPEHVIAVHGEVDDVVPLAEAMQWYRECKQPVVVIPGAGHFFHGNLIVLKRMVMDYLTRQII